MDNSQKPNPLPPPPPPPPQPAAQPAAAVKSPRKRSPLGLVVFLILGLLVIIGVAVYSGMASKIVPGLGKSTLTYWGLWEPVEVMQPLLDEFQKAHPGIKVEYTLQSPQQYRERLQSALSQQNGPDIFRIHNTWMPMFKNYLSPVPSSAYSPAEYNQTFFPAATSDFRVGNDYYAIPLEYDGIAMFVNDDLLSSHGLSVPQNWEDLRNSAVLMSECATDDGTCKNGSRIIIAGVAMGASQNVDHWQDIVAVLMLQNNVDLNRLNVPTTKAAEDVFEYFNSFRTPLGIWNENLPNSTSFFAAGKVGIYFAPSWRVFDVRQLNPNLRFSVHPIPQLPVDPARNEAPVTYADYWAEAVNKTSSNQQVAWELLKFLSSSDRLKQFYDSAVSSGRSFGEPYSRRDMLESMSEPAKTFASQGMISRSWYLASFSHDGDTGINSRLSDLFAQSLGRTSSVNSLAKDVGAVLSQYGISQGASAQ